MFPFFTMISGHRLKTGRPFVVCLRWGCQSSLHVQRKNFKKTFCFFKKELVFSFAIFGLWANHFCFCRKFFARVVQQAIYVSLGTLWGEKKLCLKKIYIFSYYSRTKIKKLPNSWHKNFGQFVKTAFYASLGLFRGKLFPQKKNIFFLLLLNIERKTTGVSLRKFPWFVLSAF